jgi:hypothetical protein
MAKNSCADGKKQAAKAGTGSFVGAYDGIRNAGAARTFGPFRDD